MACPWSWQYQRPPNHSLAGIPVTCTLPSSPLALSGSRTGLLACRQRYDILHNYINNLPQDLPMGDICQGAVGGFL